MKVGYVRVSRQDQNPDLQRRELEAAGWEKIFEEKVSSRKQRRPVLQEALDYVRGATYSWSGGSTAWGAP